MFAVSTTTKPRSALAPYHPNLPVRALVNHPNTRTPAPPRTPLLPHLRLPPPPVRFSNQSRSRRPREICLGRTVVVSNVDVLSQDTSPVNARSIFRPPSLWLTSCISTPSRRRNRSRNQSRRCSTAHADARSLAADVCPAGTKTVVLLRLVGTRHVNHVVLRLHHAGRAGV